MNTTPYDLTSSLAADRPRILLVDDELDSIRALSELLIQEGYKIRRVTNSVFALRSALTDPPDLVLLDVMMPDMDGYTLCQALKRSPETSHVPVIFMTALSDIADKAKAFAAGGADYVVKPFQTEEVLMRVKHQLTIAVQQRQLVQKNQQLVQEIQQRQQVEANLNSLLDNATEGIFRTSLEGRYLKTNPAMAAIYGYDSPSALLDTIMPVHQLYVDPKRWDELEVYVRYHQRITDAESEVYRQDGQKIWVSETIRLVNNEQGEPLYYEGTVQDVSDRRQAEVELRHQRDKAEQLLNIMLPYQIARTLKHHNCTIAEHYSKVTVLFADLVNFTEMSAQLLPSELVGLLNRIFSGFDALVGRYQLEKIKTIGDAYMVAGGLPEPTADHLYRMSSLALDMRDAIALIPAPTDTPLQIRIGMHTGPVVAGVIGKKRLSYDLWGDTVNLASRMESTGQPGKIQVTEDVYQKLHHEFRFTPRGEVTVKGKGNITTYWLEGKQA